jgi:hypothetical protein
MRPYENRHAQDPKVPYPMLGHYSGLWYDNPCSAPSYDVASRVAWEKHFRDKFGVAIWDPPSHPDHNVRREWARFWAEAWTDYYLWRKQRQDELLRRRGRAFCHTAGNFSFISHPHGTIEFYLANRGIVDMPGPSEYVPGFCRGRFHFLIKTMLAVTHGRPGGKFYPNDLQIAESLAVAGTNTYRPDQAEFLAANVDLYGRVQPGGRIAVLFHVGHNLVESHLVDLQELVDQITDLGYPYEVVIEDDLGLEGGLAKQFPMLILAQTDLTEGQAAKLSRYLEAGGQLLLIGDCLVEGPRTYDLKSPPRWRPDRTVASLLTGKARNRAVIDQRQFLPAAGLRRAIDRLGGPGFRLDPADPHVLLNVLRQPKGDLTLLGLVNYSGQVKRNVAVRVPRGTPHAGWISRDGGGGMLSLRDGRLVVPELRYGCTVILGRDRAGIERVVERNAERFARPALSPDDKRFSAMTYGSWHARRIPAERVPGGQTLCRHRVGATDRGGYVLLDILAPKAIRAGQAARFDLRVLDTRYDYVEYWQLILEETTTGQRTTVTIPLPADNPHGAAGKLRGATLTANWTPKKTGTYQGYLAYRVTRLYHDGEPFLEPENVPAGHSGNTPANLFLRSQPVMKRPYEDRLRGLVVRVQ